MDALGRMTFTLRLTRDAIVGTYALVLYEFFIMLDREYEAIYKSRWTIPKCLYLACRFGLLLCWPIVMYALLFDHNEESCQPFLVITSILFMLFPCPPQCLYVLRAYTVTGAKRWLLVIYLPCLFAYLFAICWNSLNEMTLQKGIFRMLGRTACLKAVPQRYNSFFWMLIAGIALDSVIGLMLVIHFIRLRGPQTGLENLLITQGILYFPVMFLLHAVAAGISSVGPRGYSALALSAVAVMSNILACRFIIQIREYASNNPSSPEMVSRVRRDVGRPFLSDLLSRD